MDLRKNIVLVSLIVGVDGWDRMTSLKKEKALDQSQEPTNNIGGELINRNSSYLECEPSRTAPHPEEPQSQPDFPTNVELHFNIDRPILSTVYIKIGIPKGGLRMFSLFEFAVGVRLLMFVVFVACVYGGNALFVHLEHRKTKFLWKLAFVTLYSIFLLLVTYVVWLVFYFGLNA